MKNNARVNLKINEPAGSELKIIVDEIGTHSDEGENKYHTDSDN
jgi:hypothetical protein